jgi:hypothetical protein
MEALHLGAVSRYSDLSETLDIKYKSTDTQVRKNKPQPRAIDIPLLYFCTIYSIHMSICTSNLIATGLYVDRFNKPERVKDILRKTMQEKAFNPEKKSKYHLVFPGGLPSNYYPGPTLPNFGDLTRTGALNVVCPTQGKYFSLFCICPVNLLFFILRFRSLGSLAALTTHIDLNIRYNKHNYN